MEWLVIPIIFFLPAGIANMAPIFANRVPLYNKWKTPVDFGRFHNKKRIFGDNKTWRGLVAGTFAGGISAYALVGIFGENVQLSFTIGCALGFGALAGDIIESYLKRQRGIPPGNSWFPFDQLDYVIGGLICAAPFVRYRFSDVAVIVLVYFGLHIAVSYIGFLLKLKERAI